MPTTDPPPDPHLQRASSVAWPRPAAARILVVDDEPVMGSVLRRIFGASHEVTVVERGQDALSIMDGGTEFDVVFCDVVMPEFSGPQVYEAVRQRHPRQVDRFVFITGGALQEKNRQFLASIKNPVLSKPFELSALRETVRRLLSRPS